MIIHEYYYYVHISLVLCNENIHDYMLNIRMHIRNVTFDHGIHHLL